MITDVLVDIWVDIADRSAAAAMGLQAQVFADAMRRVTESTRATSDSLREMNRAMGRIWREHLLRDGDPLHRPDGRPRRTGHRHRGTAAWATRHG